jgi:hypothetical protein
MTGMHREVLFWLFVGFFVVIGLVALLAITGVVKTEPRFRRWAVGSFVVAVTGVVIVWAKSQFPVDLFVTLMPPEGAELQTLAFERGLYEYDERTASGTPVTRSGHAELSLGVGGWQVKLPPEVMNKAVRLALKDKSGSWWETNPFYPNFTNQSLVPGRNREHASVQPEAGEAMVSTVFAAHGGSEESAPVGAALRRVQTRRDVKFDNYAKRIGEQNGTPYYRWRVFVDEPKSVLDNIKEVHYLLHPTFPQPLRIRTNRADRFALETSGWGEFTLHITIVYTDGTSAKTYYYLRLDKPWP